MLTATAAALLTAVDTYGHRAKHSTRECILETTYEELVSDGHETLLTISMDDPERVPTLNRLGVQIVAVQSQMHGDTACTACFPF